MVISSETSENLRPMNRLMEKMVLAGLVTACRLAGVPTRRWPSRVKATTDGVVRPPSLFSMTVGSPPSRTAMQEFVVPRSMPMVLAMELGGSFSLLDEEICVTLWQIFLVVQERGSRLGHRGLSSHVVTS